MTETSPSRRITNILLIDREEEDYKTIENLLSAVKDERFHLHKIENLEEVRDQIAQGGADIILLDLSRPDFLEIEAFQKIQLFAPKIPVIVLVDPEDEELAIEAIMGGAQGFLALKYTNRNLLVLTIINAIERKWTEDTLHHLIEMEKLMTVISTHFINVGPRQVDEAINRTLRTIGRFALVDRCYLYQFSREKNEMTLTHEWSAGGIAPRAEVGTVYSLDLLRDVLESIHGGRVLNISRSEEPPEEIWKEIEMLGGEDALSTLATPMKYADVVEGFWGFDCTKSIRSWREEDFNLLMMVGEVFSNILGKMKVEQKLDLLTNALQVTAHGVVITDFEGTIQWVNQAFTKMTGYESEEVVGRSTRLLNAGEHPRPFFTKMWKMITSGRVWFGEVINRRKDGTHYTEEQTITPVKLVGDRITHYISIKLDITERKIAERALRTSEERYRSLFQNAILGIFQTTPDGRILVANPAVVRMLGYSSFEELSRLNLEQNQHLLIDTRENFKKIMERDGQIQGMETIWKRKDGTTLHVRESASAIKDLEGNLLYYEGTVEDISKRKRAEEDAIQIAAEMKRLIDTANAPIFGIDNQGKINEWNRASEEVTKLPKAAALGMDLIEKIIDKPSRASMREVIEKARSGEDTTNYELPFVARDGRRIILLLSITARRDVDGSVTGFLGVGQDITERKSVEQLKDEFVSIVSHELRTPLTSIHGSLGLLSGGIAGELSEETKELLSIAQNASHRLVWLTNDILDIQKIEAGSMVHAMAPLDLFPLLEQSVLASEEVGKQFNVTFKLGELCQNARVSADPGRLGQVMANLLSNAAKFSPPGEMVTISLHAHDDHYRVSVADRGTGIPEVHRERIFEKFARLRMSGSRRRGGTGLGLSICKAIIEQHGGRISFDSEPGVGTTFYFNLPKYKER